MITGMDRTTGLRIEGDAHLAQSIEDLLTTRIGTRVMRRDYGCLLADLLGQPVDAALRVDAVQAVAMALAAWEPRVRLRTARISQDPGGRLLLDVELGRVPTGEELRLSLPL